MSDSATAVCDVPPTSSSSSSEVVASHYNALPETGLQVRTQSRIYHLRNFNNWLKSQLIGEFLERLQQEGCPRATVLDFCCGKGGDLLKWCKGRIGEVVMTDIAKVSLENCRERYISLGRPRPPFPAHFVPADLCEVSLPDHLPGGAPRCFDLTSCQFALHYSFRSEHSARRMLANATAMLRPGGYFIGTVPDASVIMQYLRRSPDGRFANEICSVAMEASAAGGGQQQQQQPPLFGAQIQFHLEGVVDCPEYLCYFPLLKQMLEAEMDMELVWDRSFPDAINYFLETRGREARDLMLKMSALETVRIGQLEGKSASGEYGPAIVQLQSASGADGVKQSAVGTLSVSEWQVVTMYRAFAFRRRRRQPQQSDESNGDGEQQHPDDYGTVKTSGDTVAGGDEEERKRDW